MQIDGSRQGCRNVLSRAEHVKCSEIDMGMANPTSMRNRPNNIFTQCSLELSSSIFSILRFVNLAHKLYLCSYYGRDSK